MKQVNDILCQRVALFLLRFVKMLLLLINSIDTRSYGEKRWATQITRTTLTVNMRLPAVFGPSCWSW